VIGKPSALLFSRFFVKSMISMTHGWVSICSARARFVLALDLGLPPPQLAGDSPTLTVGLQSQMADRVIAAVLSKAGDNARAPSVFPKTGPRL
jgi:hypothetical protein